MCTDAYERSDHDRKDLAAGKGFQGLQFAPCRQSHRGSGSAQIPRRTFRCNDGLSRNVSQDKRGYRRLTQHGRDQVASILAARIHGRSSSYPSSCIAFGPRHHHRSCQRMALCEWKPYTTRHFPIPSNAQYPRTSRAIDVFVER